MDTHDSKTHALRFVIASSLLSQLLAKCLFNGAENLPPPALALGTAVCTLAVAYLAWPMLWRKSPLHPLGIGLWAVMTAGVAILLMMTTAPRGAWLSISLTMGAGVLIVCGLLGTLTLFLNQVIKLSSATAHRLVFVTLILTGTAPLWLGPLAGLSGSQQLSDFIIALSPIGYLTSLIGYDVLRSAWFYTHAPFGGLRYDYPNPAIITLIYCGLALLLLGVYALASRRFVKDDAKYFTSLHTINKEPTI